LDAWRIPDIRGHGAAQGRLHHDGTLTWSPNGTIVAPANCQASWMIFWGKPLGEQASRERAERYLKMATATGAQAARSDDPTVAEVYLLIAAVWAKLAEEVWVRMPANDTPSGVPCEVDQSAWASDKPRHPPKISPGLLR
jgi:hypothetical protein